MRFVLVHNLVAESVRESDRVLQRNAVEDLRSDVRLMAASAMSGLSTR